MLSVAASSQRHVQGNPGTKAESVLMTRDPCAFTTDQSVAVPNGLRVRICNDHLRNIRRWERISLRDTSRLPIRKFSLTARLIRWP